MTVTASQLNESNKKLQDLKSEFQSVCHTLGRDSYIEMTREIRELEHEHDRLLERYLSISKEKIKHKKLQKARGLKKTKSLKTQRARKIRIQRNKKRVKIIRRTYVREVRRAGLHSVGLFGALFRFFSLRRLPPALRRRIKKLILLQKERRLQIIRSMMFHQEMQRRMMEERSLQENKKFTRNITNRLQDTLTNSRLERSLHKNGQDFSNKEDNDVNMKSDNEQNAHGDVDMEITKMRDKLKMSREHATNQLFLLR